MRLFAPLAAHSWLWLLCIVSGAGAAADAEDPANTIPYYQGIQPYTLLAEDIVTLKLNASVREILEAVALNPDLNQFVTLDAGLNTIAENMAALPEISPELIRRYQQRLRTFFAQQHYYFLSVNTIDQLVAAGQGAVAGALADEVNRLVPATLFSVTIERLLQQAGIAPDSLDTVMPIINRSRQETLRYSLVYDQVGIQAAFPSVEASVADCMGFLTDSTYPSRAAFAAAAQTLLLALREQGLATLNGAATEDAALGCVLAPEIMDKFASVEAAVEDTATALKEAQCALMANAVDDPALLLTLEKGACETCATQACRTADDYIAGAVATLAETAVKPYFRSDLEPVALAALPGCSECALPLQGVTYGFYPYWQASGEYRSLGVIQANPGYLDFSMLTRIAYFALAVDRDGQIKDRLHWQNTKNIAGFVQQLSRYNVQRDIVLYLSAWQDWKNADDIKAYAEANYSVLSALQESTADDGGINGVTLYFDDYGRETDPFALLTYVTRMAERIRDDSASPDRPWLTINLLLALRGLNDQRTHVGASVPVEQSYFAKLAPLFTNTHKDSVLKDSVESIEQGEAVSVADVAGRLQQEPAHPMVENILVFLQESTSLNKKRLRMQLENEFKGEARIDAQEKIIPVLGRLSLDESVNETHRQFIDDLAYLKYNFGGIGLWQLPYTLQDAEGNVAAANAEMQILSKTLRLVFANRESGYVDTDKMGWLGSALHAPELTQHLSVCGFACPNRAWMWPILVAVVLFNWVVFVLNRCHCPSRQFISAHYRIFWLLRWLPLLLLVVTFGCNPALYAYSNRVLLLVIALLLAMPLYRSFVRMSERLDQF